MSRRRSLEVQFEDRTPRKWCVSLREDVLAGFISQGGTTVHSVFGDGTLFSPLLFGKFFDPSDAFPLWDFESEILLSGLRSSGRCSVDWFATDKEYVLKAELPGKCMIFQSFNLCMGSQLHTLLGRAYLKFSPSLVQTMV